METKESSQCIYNDIKYLYNEDFEEASAIKMLSIELYISTQKCRSINRHDPDRLYSVHRGGRLLTRYMSDPTYIHRGGKSLHFLPALPTQRGLIPYKLHVRPTLHTQRG